jgi:hypothetical protein
MEKNQLLIQATQPLFILQFSFGDPSSPPFMDRFLTHTKRKKFSLFSQTQFTLMGKGIENGWPKLSF